MINQKRMNAFKIKHDYYECEEEEKNLNERCKRKFEDAIIKSSTADDLIIPILVQVAYQLKL